MVWMWSGRYPGILRIAVHLVALRVGGDDGGARGRFRSGRNGNLNARGNGIQVLERCGFSTFRFKTTRSCGIHHENSYHVVVPYGFLYLEWARIVRLLHRTGIP